MNGIVTMEIDTTAFNRVFQTLGDVVEQDGVDFVQDETARLAEECSAQLSARHDAHKLDKRIDHNIGGVFKAAPPKTFTGARARGNGMIWLYASPDALVGINPLRDHRADSVADMARIYYPSRGIMPANRYEQIGTRKSSTGKGHAGYQHIMEVRRLIVRRQALNQFKAQIKSHIGRLEASFAYTAQVLRGGTRAKVKAFIRKHFPSMTNITRTDGLSNKQYPSMEFGSFAPGVERFASQIQAAINVRARKMTYRWNLICSDYSKDVAAGISPRRKAKEMSFTE